MGDLAHHHSGCFTLEGLASLFKALQSQREDLQPEALGLGFLLLHWRPAAGSCGKPEDVFI